MEHNSIYMYISSESGTNAEKYPGYKSPNLSKRSLNNQKTVEFFLHTHRGSRVVASGTKGAIARSPSRGKLPCRAVDAGKANQIRAGVAAIVADGGAGRGSRANVALLARR